MLLQRRRVGENSSIDGRGTCPGRTLLQSALICAGWLTTSDTGDSAAQAAARAPRAARAYRARSHGPIAAALLLAWSQWPEPAPRKDARQRERSNSFQQQTAATELVIRTRRCREIR